ncbi:hypothetical protein NSK_006447 [Nannochloropsis salina CCMP1776]|uniref:Glutamate--cysteine ligase n=1 Tax=Nannochloropsis salina CCMP1776 TaxID=1027361 RepID=A0A4D9D0F1_9STRA|nr:hypothetical protein NSK_006447 [Nannochloropsis salina CCMP1776]|eukprot:TFJ82118.1 hypothetical protein NSK_006447 [Nannochloropsis salina CCMP1776]
MHTINTVHGPTPGVYTMQQGPKRACAKTTASGHDLVGRPLFWPSSLPHLRPVRRAGVRQFLNIYHRLKDIQQDDLLWGEEVEYGILKVDRSKRRVWLSLRGKEVMESLIKKEKDYTQRKVDDNMRKAHERDSVLKEKFWFRKHLAPPLPSAAASEKPENPEAPDKAFEGAQKAGFVASSSCQDHIWQGTADEYELMSVEEILNGKGDYFLGLIPLCHMYLDYIGCDRETFRRVSLYLDFIGRRGSGETMTTAAWMRKVVQQHPEYQQDSVVTPSIAYDLMMECKRIGEGRLQCPDLLGNVKIDPIFPGEAYDVYLSGNKMGNRERAELLRAYRRREPFQTHKEGGKGRKDGAQKGKDGGDGKGESESHDEFFHYKA